MATDHASDPGTESGHDRERDRKAGVGPIALVPYGVLFGVGFLVFLSGAKNAVALYTGTAYPDSPFAYFGLLTLLTCVGSVLLLYGVYGTARTALLEARE